MRHILLTGGTGVIGSALIPRLLTEPDVHLSLLVRASSDEQLDARKSSLLGFCQVSDEERLSRVDFLRGDVCEEQLGLTSEDYGRLSRNVTGVIHAAGNVKLNQSLSDARRNACGATAKILEFVRQASRLEKLDAVSTIGVAGRMPGEIPERRLTEPRTFHNNYEHAKAEAEELLWNANDDGIPVTIHRPSMVVGDSHNGRISQFQVFYYIADFLAGNRTWGVVPELGESALDIIPVDIVADGIAIAGSVPACIGQALHLCSGPARTLKLCELARFVHNELAALGEPAVVRYISPIIAQRLVSIAGRFTTGRMKRSLSAIPFFLDYLGTCQQFVVKQTFGLLSPLGWDVPVPSDYLSQVFAFKRSDFSLRQIDGSCAPKQEKLPAVTGR